MRLCLCNDMTKLHEMTFRGTPAEVRDQLLAKGSYDKGEYVLLCEVEEDYLITEVEHVSSPEALLVDCMVRCMTAPPRTPSSCFSRTTTTPTAKTSSTPRILP